MFSSFPLPIKSCTIGSVTTGCEFQEVAGNVVDRDSATGDIEILQLAATPASTSCVDLSSGVPPFNFTYAEHFNIVGGTGKFAGVTGSLTATGFGQSLSSDAAAHGLAVAASRQKRRVRFATAAALINEMVEAKHQLQLGRALARWARYDLIALDEVGYIPLAEVGAEFLFQVIAERAEKAAVIVTANLPFSEWTQVVPNPRLCKALLDRITDRAYIIETGIESYRFRRTLEKRKGQNPDTKS
jgi:hypothetical protein